MRSAITKKYRRLFILFETLSLLAVTAPLAYYTIVGFINGGAKQKFTLGVTFALAFMLVVINLLFKYNIRSTLWILVLGIYFCLDNIMTLLLMVAVGTMLDEFILSPLAKSYKHKMRINREIDRRG